VAVTAWSVAVSALIFGTSKDTNYIVVEISFFQFYSNRTVDLEETGKKNYAILWHVLHCSELLETRSCSPTLRGDCVCRICPRSTESYATYEWEYIYDFKVDCHPSEVCASHAGLEKFSINYSCTEFHDKSDKRFSRSVNNSWSGQPGHSSAYQAQ